MRSNVIVIGSNKSLCGSATNVESYKLLFGEGEKAKLMYADPPYCLLKRRNKKGQLRDQKRTKVNHDAVRRYENIKEYMEFTYSWMEEATKYIALDGVICIWTNFLGKGPIKDVAIQLGFTHFYGEFVWAKLTKEGGGNEQLARIYEVALVFSRVEASVVTNESETDIWSVVTHYDEEKDAKAWGNHPNHKPFSSLEWAIRKYTKKSDLILDPFSGSGSIPSASVQLGRRVYAIELRDEWAKMTQERMLEVL